MKKVSQILSIFKTLNGGQWVLLAAVVIGIFTITFSFLSPFTKAVRSGARINGILIGTDWVDHARHSDTLMFVSYAPVERFLDVISIPRDTRFSPQGYNFHRINEIYAYHYRTKKSDKAAATELSRAVETLFSDKVAVTYYVQVDYSSFKKFIDLIGGVDIEIDEAMNYDDKAGNLHIHFEPGKQHLDGQKALEFVRYRGPAGDIGRVFRQQRFIKAVLARWKNPQFIFNTPKILNLLFTEIKTNMNLWEIMNALLELKDTNAKSIRLSQLPGSPKRNYWAIDQTNLDGLLDKMLSAAPQDKPQQQPMTDHKQTPDVIKARVEVWNATGIKNMAEDVAWILRKNGYDVVDWGNFSTRQKKTIIKDLTGDIKAAQGVADVLACGEVITRYDEKRLIDISIIIGEDCKLSKNK